MQEITSLIILTGCFLITARKVWMPAAGNGWAPAIPDTLISDISIPVGHGGVSAGWRAELSAAATHVKKGDPPSGWLCRTFLFTVL